MGCTRPHRADRRDYQRDGPASMVNGLFRSGESNTRLPAKTVLFAPGGKVDVEEIAAEVAVPAIPGASFALDFGELVHFSSVTVRHERAIGRDFVKASPHRRRARVEDDAPVVLARMVLVPNRLGGHGFDAHSLDLRALEPGGSGLDRGDDLGRWVLDGHEVTHDGRALVADERRQLERARRR